MPEPNADRPTTSGCHPLCAGAAAGYKRLLALHARPGGPPLLTLEGEAYVRQLVLAAGGFLMSGPFVQTRPHWDADARHHWLDGEVIKSFRQPAPYQTAVLAAFEESAWAAHIDDPIPPESGDDEQTTPGGSSGVVSQPESPGTIGPVEPARAFGGTDDPSIP
jgi:hypothetical protein